MFLTQKMELRYIDYESKMTEIAVYSNLSITSCIARTGAMAEIAETRGLLTEGLNVVGSIGLWPCLALMMTAVESRMPAEKTGKLK